MPVLGLSHFNLRASRPLLDKLKDFYVDVVGLRPGFRPPFQRFGYWLYAGDSDVLHLTEEDVRLGCPACARSQKLAYQQECQPQSGQNADCRLPRHRSSIWPA